MKWVVRVYSFLLLGYTGWRTYDFISSQLPKTDVSFWLSIAFLFSTEAGLLIWHGLSLRHITTEEQENIARWMTWVDFIGSLSAGIADMILRQTLIDGYLVPPALAQFLIYGLPVIMAANVAAVLLYQSNDADTQIEREKKQLRFEITRAALRDLRGARAEIAKDKKGLIYRNLRDEVTGQIDRRYSDTPASASTQSASNGHSRQEAERKQALENPPLIIGASGQSYNQEAQAAAGPDTGTNFTQAPGRNGRK